MREPLIPPDMPNTRMICGSPLPAMDMTVSNISSPGKRHPGVDEALHQQVQLAAEESGGAADQDRDHDVQRGCRQPDEQRQPRPEDEAAQQVAPQLVGAQEVAQRRAAQPVDGVHLEGRIGRQRVGEDRHQDQQQNHDAAGGAERLFLPQSDEEVGEQVASPWRVSGMNEHGDVLRRVLGEGTHSIGGDQPHQIAGKIMTMMPSQKLGRGQADNGDGAARVVGGRVLAHR